MPLNADQLVKQYILKRYRLDHREHGRCQVLHVVDHDAEDGLYGHGTDGCEYVSFTAMIACGGTCEAPAPRHYTFGEFGDLAGIIEELEREQAKAAEREPKS